MILRFEDSELDAGRFELRRGGEAVPVEPQVFDLLRLLIENRDRIVTKDELFEEVWDGRIVSDATLNSRINAARKAIGDNGADQRLIRTAPRRGFRFVGEVTEAGGGGRADLALKQDIRFCKSPGGVRLAWSAIGDEPPLVMTANWLTHLGYDWESPIWHRTLEQLATGRTLIRYDERGCGLSDWAVDDISFDAFLRDLETVVDAAGLDRFDLHGRSQGSAVAIAYAARHPGRVSRLVLLNGYAQGRERQGDPEEAEKAAALRTLIRQGWGDEHSALLPAFSAMYAPDSTGDRIRALAELQRRSASAENAMRIREACDRIDVADLLPQVKAPTLVLHVRHDSVAPFEQGRLIAATIPDAHFVPLDSDNHVLHPDEPAWERCYAEIDAFLAEA
jgi:DNA-binding winged helix-turn-helix (wHTH) protein/alpha-beta hydrolase superfamily lysophospholipase